MKKKNLLSVLKSNEFAIWVAILSVIVQSFHSYTAFISVSSLTNIWGIAQSILFAVVIDLAILFYTVRNRKDIALYAAVVMVIINAYYYYQHLGTSFDFIFGCFLSLIIPTSVYFYAEEIRDDPDPEKESRDKAEQDKRIELMTLESDLMKRAIEEPDKYQVNVKRSPEPQEDPEPDDRAEEDYRGGEELKSSISRTDNPVR